MQITRSNLSCSAGAALLLVIGVNSANVAATPENCGEVIERSAPPWFYGQFLENRGQWETDAHYILHGKNSRCRLEESGFSIEQWRRCSEDKIEGVLVRFEFAGTQCEPKGLRALPGKYNFLLGNDRSKWRTGVRGYNCVGYKEIYTGIDIDFRRGTGLVEYDVILEPGANLGQVVVTCSGANGLSVDDSGELVIQTDLGELRQAVPVAWFEDSTGECVSVQCQYRVHGSDRYGFEISEDRPDQRLVIDPALVWSTYFGSPQVEWSRGLAVDASGEAVIGGVLSSPAGFPVTPGAFQESFQGGVGDAFVTRFTGDGSALVFSTFLGGSDNDQIQSLTLDPNTGVVTATGHTESADFPTSATAFDTTYNPAGQGWDGFVSRLTADGASLVWSTYLGGSDRDLPLGVTLTENGTAVVVGMTTSEDFPVTAGAFDETYNGNEEFSFFFKGDVFVSKLSEDGSDLIYSTFIGGQNGEGARDVAAGDGGEVTVVGKTLSENFPTTLGAFDTVFNGNDEGFVVRVSADGASLVFSTLLGGGGGGDVDLYAVTVDGEQRAVVVGRTSTPSFPTTPGAFATSEFGGGDAFLTRMSVDGSALEYSTYLGGSGGERARGVVVENAGTAIVAGETGSPDFPTTPDAFDSTYAGIPPLGPRDLFLVRMSLDGNGIDDLLYGTYIGGTDQDLLEGATVALDPLGRIVLSGRTKSPDFPTTPGAFQPEYNGSGDSDAFLMVLDLDIEFVRGDTNVDGDVQLADAVALLNHLFVPGSAPLVCQEAGDINDDDVLNIPDPITLLNFLFVPGSPEPSAPFPTCGLDPDGASLGCQDFLVCP